MVIPLFSTLPIGTRLSVGPYTPTIDTIPPFFTDLIAQCNAVAAPACNKSFLPVIVCMALPQASDPTASIHTSAPNQLVICLMNNTGSSSDLILYTSQLAYFLT